MATESRWRLTITQHTPPWQPRWPVAGHGARSAEKRGPCLGGLACRDGPTVRRSASVATAAVPLHRAALTIARILAFTSSGSFGQASSTRARSASIRMFRAPTAPDSAPPKSFWGVSRLTCRDGSNPVTPTRNPLSPRGFPASCPCYPEKPVTVAAASVIPSEVCRRCGSILTLPACRCG